MVGFFVYCLGSDGWLTAVSWVYKSLLVGFP